MTDWRNTTVAEMMEKKPQGQWFVDFNPEMKEGWFKEAQAYYKTGILGNWNMLSRIKVKGPDVIKLLEHVCVNTFSNSHVGQAKHAIMCAENGKIVINGILLRLAEDEFEFTSSNLVAWLAYQCDKGGYDCKWEVVHECSWQIGGPNAIFALEKACGESVRDVKYMNFKYATIKGIKVMLLRQSMCSELGFEVIAPMEYDEIIRSALAEAGEEFGIVEYGSMAATTQETESGYLQVGNCMLPAICGQSEEEIEFREALEKIFPGTFEYMMKRHGSYEFQDVSELYRSPIEIGEGKMVKFDHDFIGRKALEAEHANPKRKFVGLMFNQEDCVDIYASYFRQGQVYEMLALPHNDITWTLTDKVLNSEGKIVGTATQHCYSPWFRTYLANASIDVEYSRPGQELTLVWGNPGPGQKHIRVTVVKAPIKEDHRFDNMKALPSYL